MIEAMACGTPVIAYNCGSVPEVIEDGLTGFIVENEDEAAAAARAWAILDRLEVRRGSRPGSRPRPWPVGTSTSTIGWKKRDAARLTLAQSAWPPRDRRVKT
jgi:glycosyltransferase involved in cell wall biosynthesis